MRVVVDRVSKQHVHRGRTVTALSNVSLQVASGEFVAVVGASGCGKTTLLKMIAGLQSPTSGRVSFDGVVEGRPATALVFQDHGLFPWMTVVENVAFGMRMRGTPRDARDRQARALLQRVGLESEGDRYPHTLSVGMQQRVNIARAFLYDAHVLLMDEPLASLDALTKLALQQELVRLWEARRNAVVYVTHDIEEAVMLADRVVIMKGHGGTGGAIADEIAISLPRPRDLQARHAGQTRDLADHVWRVLEDDVRAQLAVAP